MNYNGPSICEIFMPAIQDLIPKVKGVLSYDNTIFASPLEEMSPLLDYNIIKEIMGDNISNKSKIISRNPQ